MVKCKKNTIGNNVRVVAFKKIKIITVQNIYTIMIVTHFSLLK